MAGRIVLVLGASFVGIMGGHMIINAILGPRGGSRAPPQQMQQAPPQ